jgi:DNA polymerase III epsilon subunit-like protein
MEPRRRLKDDPALASYTFVVVDFEATTPTGARPEPIDVAAIHLRLAGHTWAEIGRFNALMRPPDHASVTPFDTAQTGITAAMVSRERPASQVLAELDHTIEDGRPYLLVAHNAHTEAGIIHDYRGHCPRLAQTDLLDTVRLARAAYPDLGSHTLDTLIDHLNLTRPPDRHRAMPDAQITAAVFSCVLAQGDRDRRWSTLRDLRQAGGITAKANRPQQDSLFDPGDQHADTH